MMNLFTIFLSRDDNAFPLTGTSIRIKQKDAKLNWNFGYIEQYIKQS